MEIFLEVLKKVTVFMIIGKTILNLGVGKEFEKYIKSIMAFMVILQIWAGINSTLQVGWRENEKGDKGDFYSSWEEEMKDFEQKLRLQQKEIEANWKEKQPLEEEVKEEEMEEKKRIQIEKIKIG